jgi:signal peptide peptidase SppA
MNDGFRTWAIEPAKLAELTSLASKLDAAALNQALAGKQLDYSVRDGVAVLPIEGVLSKRASWFTVLLGGATYPQVETALKTAMADATVKGIVLLIDSPGGEVDGAQALANVIRSYRDGSKPVVALFEGSGSSSAYWIGSSASEAFIADDTTSVGSIGVVVTHYDYSQREAAAGVKVTEIVAGRYKRVASSHGPLSSEGRDQLQEQVDHVYSVLVDAVAENRGVPSSVVLDCMADGKTFIGQQAVDAGLVDGVRSLSEVVAALSQGKSPKSVTASSAKPPVRRRLALPQSPVRAKTMSPAEMATAARRIVDVMAKSGTQISVARAVMLVEARQSNGKPSPAIVADLARLYQAEQAEAGLYVTAAEAVMQLSEQFAARQ